MAFCSHATCCLCPAGPGIIPCKSCKLGKLEILFLKEENLRLLDEDEVLVNVNVISLNSRLCLDIVLIQCQPALMEAQAVLALKAHNPFLCFKTREGERCSCCWIPS